MFYYLMLYCFNVPLFDNDVAVALFSVITVALFNVAVFDAVMSDVALFNVGLFTVAQSNVALC